MDQAEAQRRWTAATEFAQAAEMASRQQHYRACVGLAYYACFQAMWVAVGTPPAGRWHHLGLMRQFCAGHWADPPLVSTQLGAVYRRLLALYELRLDADYRAYPLPTAQAQQGLETMRAVLEFVRPARVREETL
jgi:uncharacterized protein (UPF0332 family)